MGYYIQSATGWESHGLLKECNLRAGSYLGSGGDKQDVADVAADLLEQRLRDQLRSKQAEKSSGQAIRTDSLQLKDPFKDMDGKPSSVPDEDNLPSPEQMRKPDG